MLSQTKSDNTPMDTERLGTGVLTAQLLGLRGFISASAGQLQQKLDVHLEATEAADKEMGLLRTENANLRMSLSAVRRDSIKSTEKLTLTPEIVPRSHDNTVLAFNLLSHDTDDTIDVEQEVKYGLRHHEQQRRQETRPEQHIGSKHRASPTPQCFSAIVPQAEDTICLPFYGGHARPLHKEVMTSPPHISVHDGPSPPIEEPTKFDVPTSEAGEQRKITVKEEHGRREQRVVRQVIRASITSNQNLVPGAADLSEEEETPSCLVVGSRGLESITSSEDSDDSSNVAPLQQELVVTKPARDLDQSLRRASFAARKQSSCSTVFQRTSHRGEPFTLLTIWTKRWYNSSSRTMQRLRKSRHCKVASAAGSALAANVGECDDDPTESRGGEIDALISKWVVIHPYNPWRGVWDLLSLLFVLYDLVTIPMQLLEPPETPFHVIMTWMVRVYWTLDLPLSFIRGNVTSSGAVELSFLAISCRYLKTWFFPDFAIILSDWSEILMLGFIKDFGVARVTKITRIFRIVRMVRLVRLVKLVEVGNMIQERIRSEKIVIVTDIVKMTMMLLSLAHFVACCWFGLGVSGWVQESGAWRESVSTKYMLAVHWSLSQFTGGMDEVVPGSSIERLYAIFVFLLGFTIAALYQSNLTSSMTQLQIIGSHESQRLAVLRRFLAVNGISGALALRVQRNALHAKRETEQMMLESSVELFGSVSDPLKIEIHFEMYTPIFRPHPFFNSYIDESPQVMRRICHFATTMGFVNSDHSIFFSGEIATEPRMYIVAAGMLDYEDMDGDITPLMRGDWASEASLWTDWMHRGTLTARTDAKVAMIDTSLFGQAVINFRSGSLDPTAYAKEFIRWLNEEAEDATDISTMDCPSSKWRHEC
eukprot:TRINITY_DN16687_c0_g1_i1.p1 TRINITY_DN16687_c0_g1~~TRINITY_DN16687_c0_g1_i1.p1  ORF type:complete len:877 (-),score=125.33 TRINITY_DN16687_c0_g1_i1:15-2645(-)